MTRILYLDDEPALLDIGKTYLELKGEFRVDTVRTFEEARDKILSGSYDAIISDYEMPGVSGIDFLKYVRAYHNNLPFILFTGRGREEVVIEALNNGADFYLQKGGAAKPQFAELKHKIRLAIERRQAIDELSESRQRMTDIIDHLPDATFAIDLEGKVIAWNRAMEEMSMIKKDDILAKGDHAYALPFYGIRRPILLDLILRYDPEIDKNYSHILRKDGNLISEIYSPLLFGGRGAFVWFIASPLYDTHGTIIGAIESVRDITDRKKAEMALRESEQKYRAILDNIQDVFYRTDRDGNLIMASSSWATLSGFGSLDECIGKNIAVTFYKDPDRRKDLLDALYMNGSVSDFEIVLKKKDGSPLYISTSSHLYYDQTGAIAGIEGLFRDITERKQAEKNLQKMNEELHSAYEQLTATEEELRQNYEELNNSQQLLRQSEERFRNVIEDQTEFICRFTPDGTLTFVNGAYCRYFGLDRESCIGSHHTVSIPPEDVPQVKQHFSAFSFESPVALIEHRIRMPDGETRWQRWSDRAIFGQNGKITEFQSVGRDITQRKEREENLQKMNEELHSAYEQLTATEEELRQNYEELNNSQQLLRQSEERFRNVVEDQTEFICRFTPDGTLTFVNGAYCRYFGLDRESCIGSHHTVSIPPEDVPRVRQHFSAFSPENSVAVITHRIRMPDGETRWQRWSDRAIFDQYGQITEFQSVGRDITRRKEIITRRKEVEEALRESEVKYRSILNNIQDVFYRTDRDGNLVLASPSWASMIGGDSLDECIGKNIAETFWMDPEKRVDFVNAIYRNGSVSDYEAVLKKMDGTPLYISTNSHLYYSESGAVAGVEGLFRDITGRKQADEALLRKNEELHSAYEHLAAAEEELRQNYEELINSQRLLRQSEEKYRRFFRTSRDPVFITSKDGKLLDLNDALGELFGYSEQELMRVNVRDLYANPEDREKHISLIIDQGFSREFPVDMRRKDSSVIHTLITSVAWHDTEGNVAGFQGTIRDITERRRAKEALKEKEAFLNSIFHGSPVLQFVVDRNHKVVSWNRALEKYTGILAKEVINTGQHWKPFYPEPRPCLADLLVDDAVGSLPEWYEKKINKSLIVEGAFEAIDYFPSVGAAGAWLYFTAAPVRDAHGTITGSVETLVDITERKMVERSLQKVNEKLNILNSITRHDILNQIMALRAYIGLTRDKTTDKEILAYIDKKDEITQTIQKQIEFTRNYQNIGVHAPEWQDLAEVIGSAVSQLKPHGITVNIVVAGVEIFTDPLIEKVFYNLMENTLRHGGYVTHMDFSWREAEDGLIIAYCDNGAGITITDKDKLFQKGFGKHTGLGLFLSREILSITGITITENGEPGTGARFEMTVPKGSYRFCSVQGGPAV
ncbi:MAG: PAS domain S-box protein [Methanoregula sp.]